MYKKLNIYKIALLILGLSTVLSNPRVFSNPMLSASRRSQRSPRRHRPATPWNSPLVPQLLSSQRAALRTPPPAALSFTTPLCNIITNGCWLVVGRDKPR